jgi:hypothetical protein
MTAAILACLMLLAPADPADVEAGAVAPKKGSGGWKRAHPFAGRLRPAAPRDGLPAVSLVNLHTLEVLPVVGRTVPARRLTGRFFRCRYTDREARLEAPLVGWLLEAAWHFGAREVHVVSAFRSEKLNEVLRKKGHEVARESNHRLGKAVDFALPGVATDALFRYLRHRRLGGVGRYPDSQFVHLDTGRPRTWGGR